MLVKKGKATQMSVRKEKVQFSSVFQPTSSTIITRIAETQMQKVSQDNATSLRWHFLIVKACF